MYTSKSLLAPFVGNQPSMLAWTALCWLCAQGLLAAIMPQPNTLEVQVAALTLAVEGCLIIKTMLVVTRSGVSWLRGLAMFFIAVSSMFYGLSLICTHKLTAMGWIVILLLLVALTHWWNRVLNDNFPAN